MPTTHFLTTTTLLASLALTATAATEHIVTWSSVSFLYHGEKTPVLQNSNHNRLTPLGAAQMYNAGSRLRSRYINGTTGSVVNGMATSSIYNSQLYILGTDDNFVSASAMAAMQGLYPPVAEVGEDAINAADGNFIQSPSSVLNGYQYPALSLVSQLDFNYLWVAGNLGCNRYAISKTQSLISAAYGADVLATNDFYGNLSKSVFGGLSPSMLNYRNALDLYEYALFEHNHNTTLYNSSTFTENNLSQLEIYASLQQWEWNTPNSGNTIGAIAGRTLASKVLQMFQHNIASNGVANKMTLLFGSFEPFLSFFALSNLATGPSSSRFNSLPAHGSIMTFELFSYEIDQPNKSLTQQFPTTDNLWVQFLYRNGTDDNANLISYPLFGRGNSETPMKWKDFVTGMGAFSLNDVNDWCTACGSITLFCEAFSSNTVANSNGTSSSANSGVNNKGISASIAGVIGAVVTLAISLLIAGFLLLFGFRMKYRSKASNAGDASVLKRSGSGGFKGAEKLASDTDLRIKSDPGVGASVIRHERVGSWELGESPSGLAGHSNLDKEINDGRIRSMADYSRRSEDFEREENPFGDPVRPVDHV